MNTPIETDAREYNFIKKLKETHGSRKMAIKAKCFECLGGTEEYMPDPGWKEAIRGCSSYGCPLREFRP